MQEIDEAIEVNAMNFKSPPTLKRTMALLFRLVSKYISSQFVFADDDDDNYGEDEVDDGDTQEALLLMECWG